LLSVKAIKFVFKMSIIRDEKTDEGEKIPFQLSELECGTQADGSNPNVSIIWPVTISHQINEKSPLYDLTPGTVESA
jgi:hypothetical protein